MVSGLTQFCVGSTQFGPGGTFVERGLMEMFLWTVGSFYVCGEKCGQTCVFFPVRFNDFENNSAFHVIIYLQSSSCPSWERLLVV